MAASHHAGMTESVREVTYEGHRIRVRTTYTIDVDGEPITGHVGVTNDGRVHYHAIPTLNFGSAIDMVKQLIDKFPEDFRAHDGGHDGGHSHGGHSHGTGAGHGGGAAQHPH
jgi:hypothetical protein